MKMSGEDIVVYPITSCDDVIISNVEKILMKGVPQVFIIDTRKERCNIETFIYLSEEDKSKIRSYKKEYDQNNYRAAHSLVNYIYSSVLKSSVNNLPYGFGKYKKPYILNNFNYHYNISHSNHYVIVGILCSELGIDIEYYNEKHDYTSTAKGLFSLQDMKYIQRDRRKFFRLWVAKEAYLKYKGTGFYCDINSIVITGADDNTITLLDQSNMSEHSVFIKDNQDYIIGLSCT